MPRKQDRKANLKSRCYNLYLRSNEFHGSSNSLLHIRFHFKSCQLWVAWSTDLRNIDAAWRQLDWLKEKTSVGRRRRGGPPRCGERVKNKAETRSPVGDRCSSNLSVNIDINSSRCTRSRWLSEEEPGRGTMRHDYQGITVRSVMAKNASRENCTPPRPGLSVAFVVTVHFCRENTHPNTFVNRRCVPPYCGPTTTWQQV